MKLDKNRTPDDVYAGLPEEESVTALILRDLIRETLPHLREKLSWGAPFYHGRRSVCYVWPASVPWGKLESGVALGFSRADLLDHGGYLGAQGAGKKMGRHVFHAPEEIDVEYVVGLLRAAGANDQK